MNADALLLCLLLGLDTLFLLKSCHSCVMSLCVTPTAFLLLLTAQLHIARGIDFEDVAPRLRLCLRVSECLLILGLRLGVFLVHALLLGTHGHGTGLACEFRLGRCRRLLTQCLQSLVGIRYHLLCDRHGVGLALHGLNEAVPCCFRLYSRELIVLLLLVERYARECCFGRLFGCRNIFSTDVAILWNIFSAIVACRLGRSVLRLHLPALLLIFVGFKTASPLIGKGITSAQVVDSLVENFIGKAR